MAGSGSPNLGFRLDIKQILSEAQHRWLRPAEICEILRNYQKFHITPEPPFKPVSGSVFLFDRKVLRYFRKDGHNWRKKKDGKTVKEAHEKLKVGSVDMLHCYYAHGEDNENFQRRSYWMLEQDLMHIVFVHYLEVKGNKTNINCLLDNETVSSSSQNDSSLSFSSSANGDNLAAAYTDTTSPTSTLTSAYEEAECAQPNAVDSYQSRSRVHSYPGTPQSESIHGAQHVDADLSSSYSLLQSLGNQTIPSGEYMPFSQGHGDAEGRGGSFVSEIQRPLNLESWEEVWRHSTTGEISGEHQSWNPSELQANWQYTQGDGSLPFKGLPEQSPIASLASDSRGNFNQSVPANFQKFSDPFYLNVDGQEKEPVDEDHQKLHGNAQIGLLQKDKAENGIATMGTGNCPLVIKQPQLNGIQIDDGLKKVDSFSRWMAKELGEVEGLHVQSSNGYSWSEIQTEDVVENSCMPTQLQLDADTLNFSLSQDQLFSIIDISPNWAYSNLGTKVIISGRYLKPDQEFVGCRWSCMFGEVEVSAVVLGEGVLCCDAPPHKSGLVPFYVTCSNRLACSEVREFEYRAGTVDIDLTDIPGGDMSTMHMYKRLERLLSVEPVGNTNIFTENAVERNDMVRKIVSLMEEDVIHRAKLAPEKDVSLPKAIEEQQVEKSLKEKFYEWLLHKVREDGKGPSVIDDEGQGVLHLAAALGFNWALKPMIVSGVSIDFRDVNGWTALHWAAFYGREDTVAALVSLGAACGAVTDPSAEYPLGRTPADLASAKGHKGISGFLAEGSLTSHLSLLTVKETEEDNNTAEYSVAKAIHTVSERVAAPISEEDVPDSLSMKDSLAAVCNATQAAARIHQIFRVQSFQRKQLIEQVDDSCSEEHALSILAAKTSRLGQSDVNAHAAATSIQKKYRGWKKRKEFLIIRERIVKIQAHVRGHQARKKYKPIIWSVGILEKVILRWRRKGSGLRGFRPDAVTKSPSEKDMPPPNEDDYDFLKDGRKQAEERMQKALCRVKSMAQYPEARAQYRRLLTVAEGLREAKDASDMVPGDSEYMSYPEEDLFDVENLLDDDTFMSIAFE